MDPRDPSQPPSIFRSRDLPDDRHAPGQPPRSARPPYRTATRQPLGSDPAGPPGPSRGLLIALGAGAALLLLVGGFVAASVLGPDDDALGVASPSAQPSETVAPSPTPSTVPSPTPVATPTPTPLPTPSPTPAGPPQEVAVDGWAMVAVGELNVRAEPDGSSTSNYALVRGAVVHVAEGPVAAQGLSWYRIASLGGAVGWAASGWVAEPFMTTLVEDPTLIRCGELERPVFDVVDGAVVAHDPLALGGLALPVAAFSDATLGAMELMRGVGGEACFSAQVDAAGAPMLHANITVSACGRAVSAGEFFRLRPAAGQSVVPESQVKDPVVVHPAVLADISTPADDPMSGAVRTVFSLIAAGPDATGCVWINAVEGPDGAEVSHGADTTQCFVVHEQVADGITIRAAAGGDPQRLGLPDGAPPVVVGVPTLMNVGASTSVYGSYAYAYPGYEQSCG